MTELAKWLTRAGYAALAATIAVVILGCSGLIRLPEDMSDEDRYTLIQRLLMGLTLTTASLFVLGFLARRRDS